MPAPYQPVYRPMRQTNLAKIIFWIVAGLFFLICGLASVVLTGFETGIVGVLLGGIFAILPVPVIALTAVSALLGAAAAVGGAIFALCWGAAIATLFAAIFNTVTGLVITQQVGQSSGDILTAVLVAPPVEETCKGLALLGIFLFSRFGNFGRYFTGPVDGITYALFAGAGFAFTENIAYLGRAYAGGLEASNGMTGTALLLLLFVFAIRCVGTPFGHPLFTSATGLGLGIAARSNHHIAVRIIAPLIGWLVAMMLHGLFNLTASFLPEFVSQVVGDPDSLTTVLVANGSFVVALFPLFAIGVAVAIYARQSQFRVVKRGLPQYASAGWIGQDEVDWLSTLRGRGQARKWAKQVAGAPGLGAMKEYQYAATGWRSCGRCQPRPGAGQLRADRAGAARRARPAAQVLQPARGSVRWRREPWVQRAAGLPAAAILGAAVLHAAVGATVRAAVGAALWAGLQPAVRADRRNPELAAAAGLTHRFCHTRRDSWFGGGRCDNRDPIVTASKNGAPGPERQPAPTVSGW